MLNCKTKKMLIFALVATLIAVMALSCVGVASAESGATQKLNITHITDIHYYPTYMSYKQTQADYETSAFANKRKMEGKLVLESSAILKSLINDLSLKKSDILLITGDLSSDGERDALIDVANALRFLQNTVRANGNSEFQIFVIPGNHDLLNEKAMDYSKYEGAKVLGVTRYEFAKIFAGLGYPNMTDVEAKQFYAENELNRGVNNKYLPYPVVDTSYISSTNAKDLQITYKSDLNKKELENGDLTYFAKRQNSNGKDFSLIAFDGVVGGEVGGNVEKSVFDWIDTQISENDKNLISLSHHNVLPHFSFEENWAKDYLFKNWEQTRDYLLSKKVKYHFSGHMHANDIASYVDYDGNTLYDIETASLVGKGCAYRTMEVDFMSDGASKMYSTVNDVEQIDVRTLVIEGYLSKEYNFDNWEKWEVNNFIIDDIDGYMHEILYDTMIENILDVVSQKINKPFVTDKIIQVLQDNVQDEIFATWFAQNKENVKIVLNNLYDNLQSEILKDYTYKGDKTFLQDENNKLRAYLYEFLQKIINLEVVKHKTISYTLQDFFVEAYTAHLQGGEGKLIENSVEWFAKGMNNFENGEVINKIVAVAKNKNYGIVTLAKKAISTPMDLSKGLEQKVINEFNGLLALCNTSLQKCTFDNIIKTVFSDTFDKIPSSELEDKISLFVTTSVASGIGSKIGEILQSLSTDISYDGTLGLVSLVLYDENDEYTHFANGKVRKATIEDGRLPSMLTMTMGEDVVLDRNFVWFTDKRVEGTNLQYVEGEIGDFNKNGAKIINVSGETKIYAVDYPLQDLGIVSTYTTKEIARHSLRLKGLKPNTVYSYRVGDAKKGYWSSVQSFRTSSVVEKQAFEVLAIADLQAMTKDVYDQSAELISASSRVFSEKGYDFILNMGDFVEDGRNLNQWKYALNSANKVYASVPQVVVEGNHDNTKFAPSKGYMPSSAGVEMGAYTPLDLHFDFQTKTNKNYYSFNYGGVHFVVLDTNDVSGGNLSYDQQKWLQDDLAKYVDAPTVVSMHKGLYSAGPHSNDGLTMSMRQTLGRIFSENKVELVLQGHDHIYSESYYINAKGEKVGGEYKQGAPLNNNNGGVLYVTIGSAGNKFYKYDKTNSKYIAKGQQYHTPTLKYPTFAKISFDEKNLSYSAYEYDLQNDEVNQLITFNDKTLTIIISVLGASAVVIILVVVVVLLYKGNKKKINEYKKEEF